MQNILNGIYFVTPGTPFGVGRGQKLSFSQHGHVAYQIEGNDE